MKPEEMDRREVMKTIALSPAIAPLFPSAAQVATAYTPKFFSSDELDLVATLGELILPQTETPGARQAKAHEHIDLVLSEETSDVQRTFRSGLGLVEQRSRELYKDRFVALKPEQQNAILKHMSEAKSEPPSEEKRFFLDVRKRVVFAYYTSEVGLREELDYKGKQVIGHWKGCQHPDRHGDSE
jgi:glucoside 3-dehydrogenase (cytochrome c) hitch-hiker subunit